MNSGIFLFYFFSGRVINYFGTRLPFLIIFLRRCILPFYSLVPFNEICFFIWTFIVGLSLFDWNLNLCDGFAGAVYIFHKIRLIKGLTLSLVMLERFWKLLHFIFIHSIFFFSPPFLFIYLGFLCKV